MHLRIAQKIKKKVTFIFEHIDIPMYLKKPKTSSLILLCIFQTAIFTLYVHQTKTQNSLCIISMPRI